jgi:hypothetical protein
VSTWYWHTSHLPDLAWKREALERPEKARSRKVRRIELKRECFGKTGQWRK